MQHLLREDGAELSKLIRSQGAAVFVCGDARAMAKDVHQAIVEILTTPYDAGEAPLGSANEAEAFLASLREEGRYVQDIWA